MVSETIEKYVETVRDLEDSGKRARTKAIARKLKVKEPSVTEMLRKLKENGLVEYKPYRGATLTEEGKRLAKELTKKHSTLAEFLKILGVDKKTAELDACRIEHVVTPTTIGKLRKFLKFIQESPKEPTWLKHYRHFIKTGKYPKCGPCTD